jgi:hypothetical protein
MARPGADVRKTKPFQKGGHMTLMIDDVEALFDHTLQIDTAPAHHAIMLPIRTRPDRSLQFGLLAAFRRQAGPAC